MKRLSILLLSICFGLGGVFSFYHYLRGFVQVTNGPACQGQPTPSPDGNLLLFVAVKEGEPNTGNVWIQQIGNGQEIPHKLFPDVGFQGADGFSWSPDNMWISYTSQIAVERGGIAQRQLFRMNPHDGQIAQITNGQGENISSSTCWIDHDRIAFVKNHEIYSIRPTNGMLVKISSLSTLAPRIVPDKIACSPNGKHIAFSGFQEGTKFSLSLWLIDVETGKTNQLTHGPDDVEPVWIDSNTVIFNQEVSKEHPLVLSRVDIKNPKIIQLRGDRLYFTSGYAVGTGDLYVARGSRLDWDAKDKDIFRGFHIYRFRSRWGLFW
jgi:Tol biopolymer transport system component